MLYWPLFFYRMPSLEQIDQQWQTDPRVAPVLVGLDAAAIQKLRRLAREIVGARDETDSKKVYDRLLLREPEPLRDALIGLAEDKRYGLLLALADDPLCGHLDALQRTPRRIGSVKWTDHARKAIVGLRDKAEKTYDARNYREACDYVLQILDLQPGLIVDSATILLALKGAHSCGHHAAALRIAEHYLQFSHYRIGFSIAVQAACKLGLWQKALFFAKSRLEMSAVEENWDEKQQVCFGGAKAAIHLRRWEDSFPFFKIGLSMTNRISCFEQYRILLATYLYSTLSDQATLCNMLGNDRALLVAIGVKLRARITEKGQNSLAATNLDLLNHLIGQGGEDATARPSVMAIA